MEVTIKSNSRSDRVSGSVIGGLTWTMAVGSETVVVECWLQRDMQWG